GQRHGAVGDPQRAAVRRRQDAGDLQGGRRRQGHPGSCRQDAVVERVHMSDIAKRFGETVALAGVDFTAARGEIHGLLGENGAGKTTLMNVLSGLYRADRGRIAVDGVLAAIAAPSDALGHGIGMVHQHVELIPNFSALENVLLGREGGRLWLRPERHCKDVEAVAARFGLALDLDTEVRQLAVGVQQKVEILKSAYRGVDILILDEPTTMLTPQEVDTLFGTLRAMADQGLTVVFITHKIREILTNCDRVTVMRGGRRVATIARDEMDEGRLVELMIGERLQTASALGERDAGAGPATALEAALEVRDLAVQGEPGRPALAGCSFRVDAGEVVGVAGVAGNGQRELADALAGALRVWGGRILLGGRDAMAQARAVGGRLLVATNPTRGLDVRATEFVRGRCLGFAASGGGVLLISEDLDELRQLCQRIVVMFRGTIVADLPRARFDPYAI